jgi:hypothetical protein
MSEKHERKTRSRKAKAVEFVPTESQCPKVVPSETATNVDDVACETKQMKNVSVKTGRKMKYGTAEQVRNFASRTEEERKLARQRQNAESKRKNKLIKLGLSPEMSEEQVLIIEKLKNVILPVSACERVMKVLQKF